MDNAGEECIIIRNINGLHRTIAHGIVTRRSSMNGKELRFLRTQLGMTQAQLADMLHREALAVNRWERGECPIDRKRGGSCSPACDSGAETTEIPRTSRRWQAGASRVQRRRRLSSMGQTRPITNWPLKSVVSDETIPGPPQLAASSFLSSSSDST